MSAVVIVAIEGVLTVLQATIPQCDVNLHAAKLVRALNDQWSIVFLCQTADEQTAATWLRAAPVPSPVYIIAAERDKLAEGILGAMGARLDRPALYLAGSPTGFDILTSKGVSTLLYRHETYVLGDWQQESSWRNHD
jgi:hypothetical protein